MDAREEVLEQCRGPERLVHPNLSAADIVTERTRVARYPLPGPKGTDAEGRGESEWRAEGLGSAQMGLRSPI